MSSNVPAPRDGAAPAPTSVGRQRPWPSTRRIVLPIVAAAVVTLASSGSALACSQPPQPTKPAVPSCGPHHLPCHPSTPVVPPTKPAVPPTHPTAPPTRPDAEKSKPAPSQTESTTATPTPSEDTCTEGPEGGDTCHVVTGSPSFTG